MQTGTGAAVLKRLVEYLTAGSDDPVEVEKARQLLLAFFGKGDPSAMSSKEIMVTVAREGGSKQDQVRMAALIANLKQPETSLFKVVRGLLAQAKSKARVQPPIQPHAQLHLHPLAGFAHGPGAAEGGAGPAVVTRQQQAAEGQRIADKIVSAMQVGKGGAFEVDFGGVFVVGRTRGGFYRIEVRSPRDSLRPAMGFQYDSASRVWSAETSDLKTAVSLVADALAGVGAQSPAPTFKEPTEKPLKPEEIAERLRQAVESGQQEVVFGDALATVATDKRSISVEVGANKVSADVAEAAGLLPLKDGFGYRFITIQQAADAIAAIQLGQVQRDRALQHPLAQAGFFGAVSTGYSRRRHGVNVAV